VESRELQQNLLVSFAYILFLTTVIKLVKVVYFKCSLCSMTAEKIRVNILAHKA